MFFAAYEESGGGGEFEEFASKSLILIYEVDLSGLLYVW